MEEHVSPAERKALLLINCLILTIGHCGGPLIMRLYFIKGGKRVWLSSWLENGGWPLSLIPLAVAYVHRRNASGGGGSSTKLYYMQPRLFVYSAVVGLLTGVDDYIYAFGVARLPVSTVALIIATQLGFTAAFAYFLVKQKFTSYSVNSIVLLTAGAAVLALHTNGDRPRGESRGQYWVGFLLTLAAAGLYGFILPLVELAYLKAKQAVTYTLVIEFQMVMSFFAALFSVVGMVINDDFKVIPREAREYELGEARYYVVLVASAIIWQCFYVGAVGIIFCSSSLFSGIVIAVLLPVTETLAVIFYSEKFQAEKGVALVLSLWGFVSYLYGEMKLDKKRKKEMEKDCEILDAQIPPQTIVVH